MHVKLTCEYVGTKFSGFQIQKNKRTVQGEIEKALSLFFHAPIKTVGSGRTDAGVHAAGQVISFLLPDPAPTDQNKFLYKLCSGVNNFLPPDISVKDPEIKTKFNARSDARAKTYIYKIYVSPTRSAPRDETYHRIFKAPDVAALREAAGHLTGTHDFTSFCTDLAGKTPTRTIYNFDITADKDEIWFTVRGNGFLKNMVRIMVGTLLAVAEGKIAPADIEKILHSRDRRKAGPTAPAKGLTLFSVEYD